MKFMDIPDVPRDYLNIQPIKLTHDDLMKAPKVFHSMFLSEKDSILSFCNGISIHLIKYPKLDYVTPGFSNPFLSQEWFFYPVISFVNCCLEFSIKISNDK